MRLYIVSFPTTLTTSLPDDAPATTPPLRSQRYFPDGKVRKEIKEKRLRSLSLYKTKKDFSELAKYGIDGNGDIQNKLKGRRRRIGIVELEKGRTDTVTENARRDVAFAELKAEVVKLRDDNEENEQQIQDISPKEVVI
ncbi:hypothetical protein C1646_762411 [Rhizophagus diaphanus]|nr:hypothetical protein C1646_762411 [Rhizophagus diaphanus] [Rhizophagus sp. MUCL 43196]